MKATLLLFAFFISAITIKAQKTQTLKQVLELKMPKTVDDEMPVTSGASVIWHPVQKKYYAVFAGNQEFPLAVFDVKGKRLSEDGLIAMMDTRGLWYNPATKLITGNGYSDNGWFTYKLDPKGIPADIDLLFEGMNQPGEQCVGTYNPAAKRVLFLNNGTVYMYNDKGEAEDSIMISWGVKKKADAQAGGYDEEAFLDYNYTSVIYTGIKGQELGFLNTVKKQVELYNIQDGYLAKIVPLPGEAIAETAFNFAYANGIYWFFNMNERKWVGCK